MEYPHSEMGRCRSCGFLARRTNLQSGLASGFLPEYCEISTEDREHGELRKGILIPYQGPIPGNPVCFRGVFDMRQTFEDTVQAGKGTHAGALEIISEDRHCPQWYPYTPGLSPEKHLEELKMLELERRREEFEHRLEENRQEFDLRLAQMSQKVQEDSRIIVEKADKFNRRITWFFFVLAALEVLGTLLALFFPGGVSQAITWFTGIFRP